MLRPPQYETAVQPSDEEINELAPGEYILHNVNGRGTVCVRADSVDNFQITYTCPFCVTRRKRDGTPTARAKKKVHIHGSGGDRRCCEEHRVAHCDNFDYPVSVRIYITRTTNGSIPHTQ